MKSLLVIAMFLTSTYTFAADNAQVSNALNQVRNAQSALYSAEQALVASMQTAVVTCRINTSLYTYEATGPNQSVAISNAKSKCKSSGTIASVCDGAQVDVCW